MLSCARRSAPDVRFGLLWVSEGPGAGISGQSSIAGARLAVEDLNAKGGILVQGTRRHVKLIERGYQNRSDAAASAARALINLDSIDILVGPQLSAHAVSASSVAEDAHVPMISPMSSNPATTAGRTFVFRLAFLDAVQGSILARYAFDDLHARRAAVLYDVSHPYSRDVTELFRQTFEGSGGHVALETFTSDQLSDFSAQLRRLAAGKPDVLLLPNFAVVDTVQMRQARALGVTSTFLGSDTWDPPSMALIPQAAGAIVARQWHEKMPEPEVAAFIEHYRAKTGEVPRATAALTYDAIQIAAAAIERSGSTDGAQVASAIAGMGRYVGAGGTLVFRGNGDPDRSAVLDMIQRGSDSLVKVIAPRR